MTAVSAPSSSPLPDTTTTTTTPQEEHRPFSFLHEIVKQHRIPAETQSDPPLATVTVPEIVPEIHTNRIFARKKSDVRIETAVVGGRISLDVRKCLDRLAESGFKGSLKTEFFDRCVDPSGAYNRARYEADGDEVRDERIDARRRMAAVRHALSSEGRKDSAERVRSLEDMLWNLQQRDAAVVTAIGGVVDCSSTAVVLQEQTISRVLAVLSKLYRPGGVSTPAGLNSMAKLGVKGVEHPVISLSAWQPFGHVIRGDVTDQQKKRSKTDSLPFFKRQSYTAILPKIFEVEEVKGEVCQEGGENMVSSWTRWVEEGEGEDESAVLSVAELMIAQRPSVRCDVVEEAVLVKCLLSCVAGKQSALFRLHEGVWSLHAPEGKEITVPGLTWGAVREAVAEPLRIASMHTALSVACTTGAQQTSGPTLPLFCSHLLQKIHAMQADILRNSVPLLILVTKLLRPLAKVFALTAKLFLPGEGNVAAFPVGSVLLQALYRELRGAQSTGDSTATTLLLDLLNEALQPLLTAITLLIHGEDPGIWLDFSGGLKWETLPLPDFLAHLEEECTDTGGTVRDIRSIQPSHTVFQIGTGKKVQQETLQECHERERRERMGGDTAHFKLGFNRGRGGVAGVLGAIMKRTRQRVEADLPLTRGIKLTVQGAVETANAIEAVRQARVSLSEEMRAREDVRAAEEAARVARLREEATKRAVPVVPPHWPGSLHYQREVAVRDDLRQKAKSAEQKQLLDEQIRVQTEIKRLQAERDEAEEKVRSSPRFTDTQLDEARQRVLEEHAQRMQQVDARLKAIREKVQKTPKVDPMHVDTPPEDADSLVDQKETAPTASPTSDALQAEQNAEVVIPEVVSDVADAPSEVKEVITKEELSPQPALPQLSLPSDPPPQTAEPTEVVEPTEPSKARKAEALIISPPKKRFKAKPALSSSRRGRDAPPPRSQKRRIPPGAVSGLPRKQRCFTADTEVLLSEPNAQKTQKDLLQARPLFPCVEDPEFDFVPIPVETDPYAAQDRSKEVARLMRSLEPPEPIVVVSALPSVKSAQYTRRKEGAQSTQSFVCLQRLKELHAKVRAPPTAPQEQTQWRGKTNSMWCLRQLAEGWTGRQGVFPEELPVTLRPCSLPLDVALSCTLGRAVGVQKKAVDEAVQEATLSQARLIDTMAVVHGVYLGYDSFLSSDIAAIIDEAASGRTPAINAKGRILLVLLKLRTPHTPENTRSLVANFEVEVLKEICVTNGGRAARAGRTEHAEVCVLVYFIRIVLF